MDNLIRVVGYRPVINEKYYSARAYLEANGVRLPPPLTREELKRLIIGEDARR